MNPVLKMRQKHQAVLEKVIGLPADDIHRAKYKKLNKVSKFAELVRGVVFPLVDTHYEEIFGDEDPFKP